MTRLSRRWISVVTGSAVVVALTAATPAGAAPADPTPATAPAEKPSAQTDKVVDNLGSPLEARRKELRQEALTDVLSKKAKVRRDSKGSTVVKVAPDRVQAQAAVPSQSTYAEIARTKTDRVFVVLVDFGDERHPDYPDQDTNVLVSGPQRFNGPAANTIPAPNRLVDNSTWWVPSFDRNYFQHLYFSREPGADSVANYFAVQSSGRYTIDGTVSDWVRVPYNQARYGRSDGYPCIGRICDNTWALVADGVNAWAADQQRQGKSAEQVREELASYDIWDRYDGDGDGDFNEPDGYIDHFQIVHAGPDQASSTALYGEDAIWSHRWYVNQDDVGSTGPDRNKFGGTQIGDSGFWVGDYTMQAENSPLGVYAHEYAHDLGLPDEYDAFNNESSTGYWTLMSAGEYLGRGGTSVGNLPGGLSAWDKLQLGWLDYAISYHGEPASVVLGSAEDPGDNAQALVVVLPEKRVVYQLGTPPEGARAWWGGRGDNLHTSLVRFVSLPANASATLTFKAWYQMESGFDTARVEVNDGLGWHVVPGNITLPSLGHAISGSSGGWRDATFDLSPYAGKSLQLRIRYDSDASVTSPGFLIDQVALTAGGSVLFADGAELGNNGWIPAGFRTTTGTEVNFYPRYYLAEYRTYAGFDSALRTGPYNYGFPLTRPLFVEHYPYQDGLLVWQWDTSMTDNNVSLHPCEGQILAVDASPEIFRAPSGGAWRPRFQVYDATLSLDRTDAFRLHERNVEQVIPSHDGVPTFDDDRSYCRPELPYAGVATAASGTTITVKTQQPRRMRVAVTYDPVGANSR